MNLIMKVRIGAKKNGKVLNEIDDLKNDIMSALNKDDKNIDDKIEKIKMDKQKTNNENDGIDDEIIKEKKNENNNGNLNGNKNNMKISGNRSPFNISSFNN